MPRSLRTGSSATSPLPCLASRGLTPRAPRFADRITTLAARRNFKKLPPTIRFGSFWLCWRFPDRAVQLRELGLGLMDVLARANSALFPSRGDAPGCPAPRAVRTYVDARMARPWPCRENRRSRSRTTSLRDKTLPPSSCFAALRYPASAVFPPTRGASIRRWTGQASQLSRPRQLRCARARSQTTVL